jgi:superfamily II DNA or RNA helicase
MVTPKTDIIQSVGRILRVKHKNPIVVDILDTHDNFQKQWFQRRRFYKKCNYRIRQIKSTNYTNMLLDWENDTTWKRVYEPKINDNNDNDNNDNDNDNNDMQRTCLININDL